MELLCLHRVAGLALPQAVLQAGLQVSQQVQLISQNWAICLNSVRVISAAPISAVWDVTTVVLSSVCWDQYLSSSSQFL